MIAQNFFELLLTIDSRLESCETWWVVFIIINVFDDIVKSAYPWHGMETSDVVYLVNEGVVSTTNPSVSNVLSLAKMAEESKLCGAESMDFYCLTFSFLVCLFVHSHFQTCNIGSSGFLESSGGVVQQSEKSNLPNNDKL